MKFTIDKDTITREIQIAQEIIASRSSLSILSNVLLHVHDSTLTLRATDLKVSFETSLPVAVSEEGVTTVLAEKLLGILRSLPAGEIEFEQNGASTGENFVIRPKFKAIDFRLRSIPADKYPEIQIRATEGYFQLSQAQFIEMVSQTVFAVSDDETRFFMNGVYMESADQTLTMVATDGRRLSIITEQLPASAAPIEGIIVPPKVLNLVRRLATGEGELSVAVTSKHVFFSFENHYISSALIDGQFPNYRRVIPESQQYSAIVERKELTEALKRIAILVEKSHRIYIDLKQNTLIIRSEETEVGAAKESIDIQYTGPDTSIALNYLYLLDPLRAISSETVSLHFTEANKAVTLHSEPHASYFHIIMPMQVQ